MILKVKLVMLMTETYCDSSKSNSSPLTLIFPTNLFHQSLELRPTLNFIMSLTMMNVMNCNLPLSLALETKDPIKLYQRSSTVNFLPSLSFGYLGHFLSVILASLALVMVLLSFSDSKSANASSMRSRLRKLLPVGNYST